MRILIPLNRLHDRNYLAYVDEINKTFVVVVVDAVRMWMLLEALWLFFDTHTNNDCFMIITVAFMFLRKYLDLKKCKSNVYHIWDNRPKPFFLEFQPLPNAHVSKSKYGPSSRAVQGVGLRPVA
jgi:hypothetical protein